MTTKKTPVTHGTLIKFANDRSGAVAIIFAFTVFIMLGIVGGAVDYGRWLTAKSKQQAAIDAAVLAAGTLLALRCRVDECNSRASSAWSGWRPPLWSYFFTARSTCVASSSCTPRRRSPT